MKKLRKNKKFVLGASVALTALMLAAATFAWYSAQDKVDNEFKSGGIPDGTVKVVELFDEEEANKALPGTKVQKEVLVENYGEVPVYVRATFDEAFTKLLGDENSPTVINSTTVLTGADLEGKIAVPSTDYSTNSLFKAPSEYGLTINTLNPGVQAYVKELTLTSGAKEYTLVFQTDDLKVVDVEYTFDKDTKTFTITSQTYRYYEYDATKTASWPIDLPTTKDTFFTDSAIKLNYHDENFNASPTASKWYFNQTDGWFYYVGIVDAGGSTPYMLSSVEIDGNKANNSYQYMKYVLTVRAEAIQATPEALDTWHLASGNPIYEAIAAIPVP